MIAPHHIQQAVERTQQALIVAEHKPSPKGQGGGSNTVEAPLPLPVGLISAKRELADWLTDWCSLVRDGLGVVANYDLDEHSRLEWLGSGERAEYLAGHDAGMDFLDEITVLTKALENPYLQRAGKKYIGWHGGGDVYVRDGQTEVTLENGETHRVASIRALNESKMIERAGTASQVADIIKAFFGHKIEPKQITMTRADDERRNRDVKLQSVR